GTASFEGYSAPTIDISGNVRPNPSESNPDMGAYENALNSSASPLPITSLAGVSKTNSTYLSWASVKDALGSTTNAADIKYLIYQGDSQVGNTVSTSYTVTGLTNGLVYSLSVAAQDTSSGETGSRSKEVSITPKYRGPKWYVANSDGSALADTSTNADLGGFDDPINHLSSAIEIAATGDTIVMMSGTHSGSNNRGIDFNSSKPLVIMGDPNYTADNIIIDAGGRDRHFTFDNGEDSTYQIIGLTLYNGKTTENGGGSVIITNSSSPVFKNVIFKENTNSSEGWEGGGAVYVVSNSNPSFYYCTFDGNAVDRTSTDNNTEASGGGIFLQNSSNNSSQFVLFEGCIFKNNVTKSNQSAKGGAVFVFESQAEFLNCLFYNNTAYADISGTNNNPAYGGAISVQAPGYYSDSQNSWVGGSVKIVNSTIVNNRVKTGSSNSSNAYVGGVHFDSWGRSEKAWFFNNIVWGNLNGKGEKDNQVWFSNESGWGGKYLDYNVIQNSSDIASLQDDHSFETDPAFSDSSNGDYTLSNASQLIGEGGPSYEGVNAPIADILGLSRPNPYGSSPDIGAYENGLSTTPYPAPVKNLTAVGGSQSVTLSWDAVVSADSVYKIYQHSSAFSIDATYFVDTTSSTSYTISGLDNTTRYYFRVSAVNTKGYEGTASSSIDITPKYSGPVWWISTSGSDTNEGSSGGPFKTIKYALEQVTAGDTVMLKSGTYSGTGNLEIEISSSITSVNFDNYKNLVLTSEKGADSTIIDAGNDGRHFSIIGNQSNTIDSTLQFIGLTFIGGQRSDFGGSFYIETQTYWDDNSQTNLAPQMQPKFKNCVFKDNEAFKDNEGAPGGSFWISNGSPIFENCTFDSNSSNRFGGAIAFGGDNMAKIDTIWFRDCTFNNNNVDDNNQTQNNPKQSFGGAIALEFGMNIIINNSVFNNNEVHKSNNSSSADGGALGIRREWSSNINPYIRISNSRFTKNKVNHDYGNDGGAARGGAIYVGAPIIMVNTLVDSNSINAINGNNGNTAGGGLFISIQSQWDNNNQIYGYSYLINNTIVDNYAGATDQNSAKAAGIFIDNPDQMRGTWFNNIIWGNRSNGLEDRQNLNRMDENQFTLV
ncbi:MAG: hypothetical protein HOG97_03580, partial [Candidatus Marinimicrobia bacterium]|nr:hypothetical protein [Candidatus Neomarinimicrobiota bacterium]